VNQFIASELDWPAKGLKLRQETRYPDEGKTLFTFLCNDPVELTLQVRRPFWATDAFEVRVNGDKQPISNAPGSFVALKRVWRPNDHVEVSMPFPLRLEAFRDNPDRFAILHGPLVLGAEIDGHKPFPSIVADKPALLASLKPEIVTPNTFRGPAELFRVPGELAAAGVLLQPFYKLYNVHYVTYWDRLTPEQWRTREEEYANKASAKAPSTKPEPGKQ